MGRYILAIDQGTTSTRAILFDEALQITSVAQQELPQHFPQSGWVEHDPEDIWSGTVHCCRDAIARAGIAPGDVAAIGLTNQRETAIVWDKDTGQPVHRAIVWQDRRTEPLCTVLHDAGWEPVVAERAGLLLDPYFSGTKIAWMLDNVEGVRARAEQGRLLFGTVDSYLIWRMTGGVRHVTDATNASRTLLFNIKSGTWDPELCAALNVPMSMLPEVTDCAAEFGTADPALFGAPIPIRGVAGDQQAAVVGQACFQPGMLKSTYGTGCFALLNTGSEPIASRNRLLTTIAYQFNGKRTYALEGSIFVAGAVVQWLRDGLNIIEAAGDTQQLAESVQDADQSVYLVPAFTGLGAPYWDSTCRGAIFGLTRATGREEMARAALESVGYQTRDLLEAMTRDWSPAHGTDQQTVLRVDGGMTASNWTMQFLADILQAPVDRPSILETTALGAAWLAGMQSGLYPDAEGFQKNWVLERRFEPQAPRQEMDRKYVGWQDAVSRTLTKRPS